MSRSDDSVVLQDLEMIQPNQMKAPPWIIKADFYKAEGGKQPKFWLKECWVIVQFEILFSTWFVGAQ